MEVSDAFLSIVSLHTLVFPFVLINGNGKLPVGKKRKKEKKRYELSIYKVLTLSEGRISGNIRPIFIPNLWSAPRLF